MLPLLEFVNTHEHVIEEEKPLESVRVSICFESETACGNSINADEGLLLSLVFLLYYAKFDCTYYELIHFFCFSELRPRKGPHLCPSPLRNWRSGVWVCNKFV